MSEEDTRADRGAAGNTPRGDDGVAEESLTPLALVLKWTSVGVIAFLVGLLGEGAFALFSSNHSFDITIACGVVVAVYGYALLAWGVGRIQAWRLGRTKRD